MKLIPLSVKIGTLFAFASYGSMAADVPDPTSIDLDELGGRRESNSLDVPSTYRPGMGAGTGSSRLDISGVSSDFNPYVGDSPIIDSLYRVGPGDLFQIFVESSSLERQVNPEGNIVLNRIGVLHVEGLTLKAAKKLILDKLQTAYKRSDCFVNLSRPKTMRVFVTGAVTYPGIYEVPGNYRVTDAVRKAGGFSAQAQKGTVLMRFGDEPARPVSLRKFMLEGSLDGNPYLRQGAVVHVPYIDFSKSWVTVRRDSSSFFVQTDPGESVFEVILKSYAYRPTAAYTAVVVREKNGRDSVLLPGEAGSYVPGTQATLEVVSTRQEIFVGGAVQDPGFQLYRSDQKIVEYISRAGLLTSSRLSNQVTVVRKDGGRESLSIQSPNLRPGDVVLVRQNAEQKFLLYTPILLSIVSLALVYIQIQSL